MLRVRSRAPALSLAARRERAHGARARRSGRWSSRFMGMRMSTSCRVPWSLSRAPSSTRADVVVSVSEDLGDYLRNQMRVPRVTVIPNGVDIDQFQPGHASRAALTLFSISRLVPRKNIHVLIAAVEQLAREGAALSLVIAGTGPEEERIKRLADQSTGRCASSGSSMRPASAAFCRTPTCSCSCRRAKACRLPRLSAGLRRSLRRVESSRRAGADHARAVGVVRGRSRGRAERRRHPARRAGRSRPPRRDETDLSRRGRGALFSVRRCARATGPCSPISCRPVHERHPRSSLDRARHRRCRVHRIRRSARGSWPQAGRWWDTTTCRAAAASCCRGACIWSKATFVMRPACRRRSRPSSPSASFIWRPCISFPTASRARRKRWT